jgi:hypothetical protein
MFYLFSLFFSRFSAWTRCGDDETRHWCDLDGFPPLDPFDVSRLIILRKIPGGLLANLIEGCRPRPLLDPDSIKQQAISGSNDML